MWIKQGGSLDWAKTGLGVFLRWVFMHPDYGSFSLKRGCTSGPWVVKFKDGSFIIFLEIGIMGRLLSRGRLLIFTNEDSGVVY